MGRYGVGVVQDFVRNHVSQRTKMVAVAGLAALALSNCIISEGPASMGTGATDNPSNGVAVANGGTASGSCLLPLGAGCIVPGASASTTGNANTGGNYSALALTGTGSASGALINVTGGGTGGNGASGGIFSIGGLSGGGGASGALGAVTLIGPASGLFALAGIGSSSGYGAISGVGQASGGLLGLTSLGGASGTIAGTGSGNASGGLLGLAGLGSSSGNVAATGLGGAVGGLLGASATGDSSGQYAVSGTGNASGGSAAVSATGDAVAPTSLDVWDDPPAGDIGSLLLQDDTLGGNGVIAAAASRYPVTCSPSFNNVGSGSSSNRTIDLKDTILCTDNNGKPFSMQMYCHVSLYNGSGSQQIANGDGPSSPDTDHCTSSLTAYGNYIPQGSHLINHFYYELTAPPGQHWSGNTDHCDGQGGRLTRCTYKHKFTA